MPSVLLVDAATGRMADIFATEPLIAPWWVCPLRVPAAVEAKAKALPPPAPSSSSSPFKASASPFHLPRGSLTTKSPEELANDPSALNTSLAVIAGRRDAINARIPSERNSLTAQPFVLVADKVNATFVLGNFSIRFSPYAGAK